MQRLGSDYCNEALDFSCSLSSKPQGHVQREAVCEANSMYSHACHADPCTLSCAKFSGRMWQGQGRQLYTLSLVIPHSCQKAKFLPVVLVMVRSLFYEVPAHFSNSHGSGKLTWSSVPAPKIHLSLWGPGLRQRSGNSPYLSTLHK